MTFKTFYQTAIRDAVKIGHTLSGVAQKLPAIISKIEESKTAVETVTTLIDPAFKTYEEMGYEALAELASTISEGKQSLNSDGSINVTHSAAAVESAKAMIATLSQKPGAPPLPAPPAPAA